MMPLRRARAVGLAAAAPDTVVLALGYSQDSSGNSFVPIETVRHGGAGRQRLGHAGARRAEPGAAAAAS